MGHELPFRVVALKSFVKEAAFRVFRHFECIHRSQCRQAVKQEYWTDDPCHNLYLPETMATSTTLCLAVLCKTIFGRTFLSL